MSKQTFSERIGKRVRPSAIQLEEGVGGMLMIPEEFQVDDALLAAAAWRHKDGIAEYDVALPHRRLAEFCAAHGIACIDLLPAFRSADPKHPLYKKRDTHWNIEGNALAAGIIAPEVAERLR